MTLANVLSASSRYYFLDVVSRYSKLRSKLLAGVGRLSNLENISVSQFRGGVIGAKWDGSVTMSISRILSMCSPSHAMRRMRVYAQSVVARPVAGKQANGVSLSEHYQRKAMGVNGGAIVPNVPVSAPIDGKRPFNAYISGIIRNQIVQERKRGGLMLMVWVAVILKRRVVCLAKALCCMFFVASFNGTYWRSLCFSERSKRVAVNSKPSVVHRAEPFCQMLLAAPFNAAFTFLRSSPETATTFCRPRFKVASDNGGTVPASTATEPYRFIMPALSCVPENCQLPENTPRKVDNARRAWLNLIHDVTPIQLRNREALREYQSPTLLAL